MQGKKEKATGMWDAERPPELPRRTVGTSQCHFCVSDWVDRAVELAGVRLADLVRRRLIALLLSRPHLILTGVPGIGKIRLARALAVSGVGGQEDRVCRLIGT